MPVETFARFEKAPAENEPPQDEVQQMMARLTIPAPVANISYPRGCRIRRVRVRAVDQPAGEGGNGNGGNGGKPVIVSRRALKSSRARRPAER
jgi:hypothetical protein